MSGSQHYPEPTVGALIFGAEGRLFLMQSHKFGGRYVVPGGHVELGETLEAALHREVAEETGLTVHDLRFICTQEFVYDPVFWQPRHFIFFDYACRTDDTVVRLNDEAEAYVWATLDEALRLPAEPYTEKAIRAYLAQASNALRPASGAAQVDLAPASPADRDTLANLMELYLYEFSEFDELDVGPDGRYGYDYLDYYWREPGRHAFFIRVDGHLAGFVLVRTLDAGDNPLRSIAEFFVMRKYRRREVGATAARWVFDHFPGRWSVTQEAANLAAQAFWRRVIGDYTAGRFAETWQSSDQPVGPCQSFRSRV